MLLGSLIYDKTSYFISSLYVLSAKILINKVPKAVRQMQWSKKYNISLRCREVEVERGMKRKD